MEDSKTAVVTGGSRGLGKALAGAMIARGWQVVVTGRDQQTLAGVAREFGDRAIPVAGDVADPEHRGRLVKVAASVGGLDAVVNNASTLGASPLPPLLDYPLDHLSQVLRVNTIAPLALLQALRPHLKAGPRVINVTSDAGVVAYEGWGGYGTSKAALEQLSAVLAVENPDWKVYWVDPGDMRTDMQQDAFPGEDISDRSLPEESVPGFLELLKGDLPSGRYQAQTMRQPPA